MALSLVSQNPPCLVRFAGFESDTFKLGRHGWEIALEQDIYGQKMRMMLRHASGLYGMAESIDHFHAARWHSDYGRGRAGDNERTGLPVFDVRQMANKIMLRHIGVSSPLSSFSMVETDPAYMMVQEFDIASLPLFRAKGQPTAEDLIVDPATVSELLEQIRQQQAPIQKDIRERARRREIIPVQHASIFTLPLAA